MRVQFTIFTISIILSFKSFATNSYIDEYDSITSLEIIEIREDPFGNKILKKLNDEKLHKNSEIGDYLAVGRDLIAFGKELYQIIEAGKPVIQAEDMKPISILPKTHHDTSITAYDLLGWKESQKVKYRVVAKNGWGNSVVSFDFKLDFLYGGQYNGKGHYINEAEIYAENIKASLFFKAFAHVKVKSIINKGTKENPIASLVLELNYSIVGLGKETRSKRKFRIDGLGKIKAY